MRARLAAALIGRIEDVVRRAALREEFEERAAILEFEAGHTREATERLAHQQLATTIHLRSSAEQRTGRPRRQLIVNRYGRLRCPSEHLLL